VALNDKKICELLITKNMEERGRGLLKALCNRLLGMSQEITRNLGKQNPSSSRDFNPDF
jgi:hypothetical protein